MTDESKSISLVLPIGPPDRWAWLTLPKNPTTGEWRRLMDILAAMKPGLIADRPQTPGAE